MEHWLVTGPGWQTRMADLLAKGPAASGETGARGVAGKPFLACSYIEKQLASSPCIEEATLGQTSFHGGRQIWDKDNSATLGQASSCNSGTGIVSLERGDKTVRNRHRLA
ncbi:MAG: hypothetical protein QE509_08235 [Gammaproteobacteria bacterium]|nr:hypothetical protein [Gammaproteobacteria bacterium]